MLTTLRCGLLFHAQTLAAAVGWRNGGPEFPPQTINNQ